MSTTQGTAAVAYRGEVVYLFAYDLAYELKRQNIRSILGQPILEFGVDASKRSPRTAFFYRSQTVKLPPIERMGRTGMVQIQRTIKLLPMGAITIGVRIPFQVQTLEDLVGYHELRFSDGQYLHEAVRELATQVRNELLEHLVRPNPTIGEDEAYTVFCLDAPLSGPNGQLSGEQWLLANRRSVAALLTEEEQPQALSNQEVGESTGRYLSYYERDLVVLDWDAALVLEEPKFRDEVLYIMELANLQLAELEAYDRLLDVGVEAAYRDVSVRRRYGAVSPQRQLQELRVDMARITDELSNITKFFGDWHLARIYQHLAARFHLEDWRLTVEDKLKTLDEIYQLLRAERSNRLMLILEMAIVLLFVADLILIFLK